MKAARLTALRKLDICEVPAPVRQKPDDVLLKMDCVGVCGSDVHYYTTGRIGSQIVKFPFTLGHEGAATVLEVGPESGGLKPGDRVVVEPLRPCHICDQCRAGRPHTCRNQIFLGCPGQAEGCLSEYLVMPAECCLKLPEGLSAEDGALSEPLTIGLYAVKLSGLKPGATVAVLGCGPIGLSVLTCAKSFGAKKIYMTDPLDERAELAKKAGADYAADPTDGSAIKEIESDSEGGVDFVFECAGRQESFDDGINLLKPGGKLMLIGIPEFDRYSFAADTARRREICIQHVRRQNDCTAECLRLMGEQKLDPGFMVTHRFPLDRVPKAFDLVADYRDGIIKAMVTFP